MSSNKDGKGGGGCDRGDQGDDKAKDGDYRVGFKKPPPEYQWPKGKSGNPRGRPKKPKPDVVSIVDRALSQTVTIREGDRTRELPADQAADLAQILKAMQGDQSAFAAVIRRLKKLKVAVPVAAKPERRGALVVRRHMPLAEWEQKMEALRERQARLIAEGLDKYLPGGRRDEPR